MTRLTRFSQLGAMSMWSRLFGRRVLPTIGWEMPSNWVAADVTGLPAVQRCIGLIASDVARCPVVVHDRDGNTVTDEPALPLLTESAWGAGLTGADLRRWMATECLVTGNAFAVIITDARGNPISLRPVSSADVQMSQDTDGVLHWQYQGTEFDYSLVVHWKALPTPGNPYWGTSPLAAAGTTLQALAYLEAAYAAMTKAGGSMGKLAFSHPGALRPETRDAMRTAFMAQHGSGANAATPIFVGEGMKIDQVAPTMASDMATLRAAGIREVATLFGVPAAYLDASDARTQPEIAQQYAGACLAGWTESWMAETTAKLATPGRRIGLDFSPVTQGDFRTAGRAYAQLLQVGALAPNDVRRRLGFAPWPGLDEPKPVISGVTPDPNAVTDPQGDPNA